MKNPTKSPYNCLETYISGNDYDGSYTSFGNSLKTLSASGDNIIGNTTCFLMAGSDGQGNLYQVQNNTCETPTPTVCRKNIGKDLLS